jgi:hypothetical protein
MFTSVVSDPARPTTVGLARRDVCRVIRRLGRHGEESSTPTRRVSEDSFVHDRRGLTFEIQKTLTEFFACLFCAFATLRERSPLPTLREIPGDNRLAQADRAPTYSLDAAKRPRPHASGPQLTTDN